MVNGVAGLMLMARATPMTAIAAEELEPNDNGKRPRTSSPEASRAPSDWRSHLERTMRQQAQEVPQRHRTAGSVTQLLEAQQTSWEAQWVGMMMWMQEREQK